MAERRESEMMDREGRCHHHHQGRTRQAPQVLSAVLLVRLAE